MTREIINWVDNKMEDLWTRDQPHTFTKACWLGAVDVLVDAMTLTGVVFTVFGSMKLISDKYSNKR